MDKYFEQYAFTFIQIFSDKDECTKKRKPELAQRVHGWGGIVGTILGVIPVQVIMVNMPSPEWRS